MVRGKRVFVASADRKLESGGGMVALRSTRFPVSSVMLPSCSFKEVVLRKPRQKRVTTVWKVKNGVDNNVTEKSKLSR